MSVQRRTLRVGPLLSAVAALLVSASWAVAVPGWSTETVDGTADSGFYNSLAFHPVTGLPAIAYSGKSGNKPTLKFAQWNGASWELQVAFTGKPGELGGISLGFDGSGNPAVSFVEITGGVKLARKTGSSWATETIDSKGAGLSSLVVHGGQPWIAYTTNNALKLAHKVGSAWTTETVDGSGMSYVSLAFAPDGEFLGRLSERDNDCDAPVCAQVRLYVDDPERRNRLLLRHFLKSRLRPVDRLPDDCARHRHGWYSVCSLGRIAVVG